MKETKRKAFNFFRSYYDVYNELNDKDKVIFMDALLDRQFLGVKPDKLKGMAKFAYISQTNSIDSQVKGYEDKTGVVLFDSSDSVGGCIGGRQGGSVAPSVQGKEEGEEEGKDIPQQFEKELIEFAERFYNALEKYGCLKKRPKTISSKNLNDLRLMQTSDGFNLEDIEKLAAYYFHVGRCRQEAPFVIQSLSSFRKKGNSLMAAIKNHKE